MSSTEPLPPQADEAPAPASTELAPAPAPVAEPAPAPDAAEAPALDAAEASAPAAALPPAPAGRNAVDCAQPLRQSFPALFVGAPKPLKLRIQLDIQARAPGAFTKQALSAAWWRMAASICSAKIGPTMEPGNCETWISSCCAISA